MGFFVDMKTEVLCHSETLAKNLFIINKLEFVGDNGTPFRPIFEGAVTSFASDWGSNSLSLTSFDSSLKEGADAGMGACHYA